MLLDEDTNWDEVAELVTESYGFAHPEAEAPTGSMTSRGPEVQNRAS